MDPKDEHRLLALFTLLGLEGLLILVSGNLSNVGFAHATSAAGDFFSNLTLILIVAFVSTLVAILVSIHFVRATNPVHTHTHNQTTISWNYLNKSFGQKKSKDEIVKELHEAGYSLDEVNEFLDTWENYEEKAKPKVR